MRKYLYNLNKFGNITEISENNPLLGHNNILDSNTIDNIKTKFKTKCALWYEDHLIKGGPNAQNNLNLIEKNQSG